MNADLSRPRLCLSALLGAMIFVAVGCDDGSGEDVAQDARPVVPPGDAWVDDASVDSAVDAAHDAQVDAEPDAAPDAAPVFLDAAIDEACHEEPNNVPSQANRLRATHRCPGRIDPRELDYFDMAVPADTTVFVFLEGERGNPLTLAVLSTQGETLGQAETVNDLAEVRVPPSLNPRLLLARVSSTQRISVDYTIWVLFASADEVYDGVLRGQVRYQDPDPALPSGEEQELVYSPASGLQFEIIRRPDGKVVHQGRLDETGSFNVSFHSYKDWTYDFFAVAMVKSDNESFAGKVIDQEQNTYAILSAGHQGRLDEPPIQISALSLNRSEVDDPWQTEPAKKGLAGPINIAVSINKGLSFFTDGSSRILPELSIAWDEGQPVDCGSCYWPGQDTIALGGGVDDPDEFDDAIILHELAHFVTDYLAWTDSPGGQHRGQRVDPVLAFDEGRGYFLAALIEKNPIINDQMIDQVRVFNMETVELTDDASEDLLGVDEDGNLREELVAGVLWDLYDKDSSLDDFDYINLEEAIQLDLLFNQFNTSIRADTAPTGPDLADWLNAVVCSNYGVNRDHLQQILAYYKYSWTPPTPTGLCRPKGRLPSPVIFEERGGQLWARWRSTKGHLQAPTLHLITASGHTTRPLCAELPCAVGPTNALQAVALTALVGQEAVSTSWRAPSTIKAARRVHSPTFGWLHVVE